MKRVITWFKNNSLSRIVAVVLAGVLLIFTQACSGPTQATEPSQPGYKATKIERNDPTKDYPLSSPAGGMNNFSDVDPRARGNETQAKARAEALKENAKRNVDEKGVDSVEQYVENYRQGTPFGQRVKNLGEDIGSSAQELTEGVSKGTQRGLGNIKDNTKDAAKDLNKNVQRAAEDTSTNVQRTAQDTTDAVKRTVREAD
jgi:hypothetical protein